MKIGIVGLPQSGKTTLFHALAGSERAVAAFSAGLLQIQTATIAVPDERVDALSRMFNPRKTIYAQVTFADIAGLDKGVGRSGLPGPFINQLGQMDAFAHVLRAFDDPGIPHSAGSIDPMRHWQTLETEFLLNDMLAVERRLERLEQSIHKGAPDREAAARERVVFERMQTHLEAEQPLRSMPFTAEEQQSLRGYGFLSLKPALIVINMGESGDPPALNIDQPNVAVTHINAKLESELFELPDEDAALFMQEYGIRELGRQAVIRLAYSLLNVLSFFTVGEDEVRAWALNQGGSAVDAAAAIHTDLAKGFIRAEVIGYQELIDLGGMREAKAKGRLRLEGKEYVVQDGEIVHIRHNM